MQFEAFREGETELLQERLRLGDAPQTDFATIRGRQNKSALSNATAATKLSSPIRDCALVAPLTEGCGTMAARRLNRYFNLTHTVWPRKARITWAFTHGRTIKL